MNIYTIGHSNHQIGVFLGMLKDAGVTHLIDVRTKPISRFAPQFNRKGLTESLMAAGLQYIYRGDALGGFGDPSPAMAKVLHDFLVWREKHPEIVPALMCAEKSPYQCHRYLWLANWIKRSSGFTVINIMPPGIGNWEADTANLPSMAANKGENITIYPWIAPGRLTGFATQNDALAYCIARDMDVSSVSRRRTRG